MSAIHDLPQGDELPIGARLLGSQYQIEQYLQRGGFGITYVARDSLERDVVIKECFPADLCRRSGRDVVPATPSADPQMSAIKRQFIREARRMAKLNHDHIVAVHQVFEENNTAYIALDKVIGVDLFAVKEDTPDRLTSAFLRTALEQCLEAIGYVHAHGVLHRDISPDNILVDDADHLTLIDFGAAREHAPQGGRILSSLIAVKDGYSPHEFYLPDTMHDFSSDLYSLAATFYHLIAGDVPTSCQVRLSSISSGMADPCIPLSQGNWAVDFDILQTIDHAMQVRQKDRFQSAALWLKALENTPISRPEPVKKTAVDPALETTISRLVQETNTQLQPRTQTKMTKAQALENKQKTAAKKRKNVVDIFGNPIEDVAQWMQEQEQEREAIIAVQEQTLDDIADDLPEPVEVVEIEPVRKSFITGLLWRCLPNKTPQPSPHNPRRSP